MSSKPGSDGAFQANQRGKGLILVVDDDPAILQLLDELLSDDGYIVLLAANAFEAFAYVQRILPDVIISDIMLPLTNGDELCRQIRTDPRCSALPIIFMSVHREYPPDTGPHSAFLRKPFGNNVLLYTINQVLGHRGLEYERLVGE